MAEYLDIIAPGQWHARLCRHLPQIDRWAMPGGGTASDDDIRLSAKLRGWRTSRINIEMPHDLPNRRGKL